MTTYQADQVVAIADARARQILTERGVPDCPAVGFCAAKELKPVTKNPSYVQIGAFGEVEAPVGLHRTDGAVVCFSTWSDMGFF